MIEVSWDRCMLGVPPTVKSAGIYTPQHLCAHISNVCSVQIQVL